MKSDGPAATGGTVTTRDTSTTIPLVPGSTVTISTPDETGRTNPPAYKASPPSTTPVVTFTEHTEHAQAPSNFAPPAPPTLQEKTDADGERNFYLLAIGCAIAAVVSFYREHMKAGAIFALAAAVIPALIHFGHIVAASHFAGIAITAAIVLIIAWHLVQHHPEIVARIKAEITHV